MNALKFSQPNIVKAARTGLGSALQVSALFASLIVSGAGLAAAEPEGLPAPAAPREAHPILPTEKTLANGLRVIVVERPGLPLVSAALVLRHGAESDPEKSAGLASFTAALLTQGTATRSATQLAREIESLGATLKATAEWDASTVELTALSANLAPAFELLADVTLRPKFAPEEVERLRRQSLDELRVSLEEPRNIAHAAAGRVLLGRGLYAHAPGGTLASLARLSRAEILAFHTAHYTAGQAQLIIAGNVTADAACALAEKVFGAWQKDPANAPAEVPTFTPTTKPRAVLIDMPQAGQAAVLVTTPAVPRSADDFFSGLVANTILGGGYTSWLNQEIRVKRGLTYGARSTFSALRAGGICVAGCQTKNESAAEVATLLRDQLTRLGTEAADAEFFPTRQAVLTGDFARELETDHGYVAQLTALAAQNLPLQLLAEYPERIRAITPDAARDFAARHYHPENLSVIVAGRAAVITKPLRAVFPQLEVIPQTALDLDSPTLRKTGKR